MKDLGFLLRLAVTTVQPVYSKETLEVKSLDKQGPGPLCPTHKDSHKCCRYTAQDLLKAQLDG